MTATLLAIYIADSAGVPLHRVDSARALPGKGLEGDRYYDQRGSYSSDPGPGRQLTLIESEAIEQLAAETGIHLDLSQARRNLVTRGVSLNDLVDKTFTIGEVTVHGVRLCHPCQYLESLTQPGVLAGLVQRGGLRADILTEGTLHPGDAIEMHP
jgi:MOSC domain-containing protein YiiM